jgi:hypothetical protein
MDAAAWEIRCANCRGVLGVCPEYECSLVDPREAGRELARDAAAEAERLLEREWTAAPLGCGLVGECSTVLALRR